MKEHKYEHEHEHELKMADLKQLEDELNKNSYLSDPKLNGILYCYGDVNFCKCRDCYELKKKCLEFKKLNLSA